MNTSVPLVQASVTLLPELDRPRTIQGRTYRPHVVIGPISQRSAVVRNGNTLVEPYLGVCFWEGPPKLAPGVAATVSLALVYYRESEDQYAELVSGATFTLREGGKIVGYGEVLSRNGSS